MFSVINLKLNDRLCYKNANCSTYVLKNNLRFLINELQLNLKSKYFDKGILNSNSV